MADLKNKVKAEDRADTKVSIKMSATDMNYALAQSSGASINRGVVILLNRMRQLEAEGLASLRGIFTPDEWKVMAIVMNDAPISNDQYLDKEVFAKALMDFKNLSITEQIYGVDANSMKNRILIMSPMQIMAVNCRIRDFWAMFSGGKEVPEATFTRWATI